MALFKFRKGGDEPKAPPPQAESVEAMRRRARHRLIGAVVLVLLGVIGFPLLFDTQPRPIAVDIPIEIPDRNKVKPLPMPPAVQAPAVQPPAASGKVAAAPAAQQPEPAPVKPPEVVKAPEAKPAAAPAAVPAEPAPKAADKPEPKVAKAEPKPESKPESKPEPKPEAKAPAKADDGAKARALLEGQAPATAAEGRYVVQVGAFSDATLAREARLKVERAGLKTYTHVAETKDGKRIRVRAGPFGTRAEADKAAEKIKGLDLPAAILTL
jgi:DedD protein